MYWCTDSNWISGLPVIPLGTSVRFEYSFRVALCSVERMGFYPSTCDSSSLLTLHIYFTSKQIPRIGDGTNQKDRLQRSARPGYNVASVNLPKVHQISIHPQHKQGNCEVNGFLHKSFFPKASFRRHVCFLDYDARFNAHGVQIQVTPSTLEYDVTLLSKLSGQSR